MAALQSAGVAGVKTLFAMPLPVVWEAGCTPSTSDWVRRCVAPLSRLWQCWRHRGTVLTWSVTCHGCAAQNCPRVYHGTWTHNGAARAVVVKVVSRSQAADEVAVLEAVGAHKQARAIQVLAQIPVNDGDVGLVTPYCPGKLFEGAPSLHHVLCQAIQLCEVRRAVLRCALPHSVCLTHGCALASASVDVGGATTSGGDGVACSWGVAPGPQAFQRHDHADRRGQTDGPRFGEG